MRNSLLSVLLIALCAGCQSTPPLPQPPPVLLPVAPPSVSVGVRTPELVRAYAVGAYVDPDDPLIRHEPHIIHRLEAPTRWNLTHTSPIGAIPVLTPISNVTPAATPDPAPSQRETELTPALPLPDPPPAPTTPVPIEVLSPPAGRSSTEPMLAPNAEGVVDLTAVESSRNPDDINPFVSRVNSAEATREITLRIQGVLGGRAPGAIINDRPIRLGEAVDALTLELIETDAAVFRSAGRLIRLPVGAQTVRIRLVR